MSVDEHTPRPWIGVPCGGINDAEGAFVLQVSGAGPNRDQRRDLIVKAVNAYDPQHEKKKSDGQWSARDRRGIEDAEGFLVAVMFEPTAGLEERRDLIIRAVNAYEPMLMALEEFVRFAEIDGETVQRGAYIRYQVTALAAARTAIANAKGPDEP